MGTVATIVGIIGGGMAIVAGLAAVARAIWRAAGDAHELVSAVRDNTAATHTLSEEFRTSSEKTAATLANHETRITHLESA